MVKFEHLGANTMTNQKDLDELTTRMVHDVRTPLTVLNMLAASFSHRLKDIPEAKEELAIMLEEITKIDKLITAYREKVRTQ
jgi:signal transduction histidine kinase